MEFDIGPLSWVKDEIDHALADALLRADEFAAAPDDTSPLRYCLTHLHQVSGALSMVGLEGAQHFAEEIERYAGALSKGEVPASTEHSETLAAVLKALRQYIHALIDGAPDNPLRLWPQYQAMQQAQGMTEAQASALFFPDLFNSAPASLETVIPEGVELPAYLDAQGQAYRKLLVQWIKAPQNPELLMGMRDALEAVGRAQALPSHKTLWWAAVGLLEAIAQGIVQLDKHARQLLLQLERQIHYLAQGNAKPNTRLLREVLYYIAISEPVTERLRDIKGVFGLDKYYESEGEAEELRPLVQEDTALLGDIRSRLGEIKDCWMQVSAGEQAARAMFLDKSRTLEARAANRRDDLMQALAGIASCAEIIAASSDALDPMFSIEMATALLMLESALGSSGKTLESALNSAVAQVVSTRAMLPGKETQPAASATAEISRDETLAVLAQVADEIRANLRSVEQALDDFFRNAGLTGELAALSPLFKQVGGAFHMLEQPVAAAVIKGTQALVERFAQSAATVTMENFELVAESISALDFYLDRLLQGDNDAGRAIAPIPGRLADALAAMPAGAADAAIETTTEPVAAPEAVFDRALDDELLEVYLAEASEVHETIIACMQALRTHPDDHDQLITLRRAFHTLKGSGRTVGLTAMGEVAWAVEQVLNHLIDLRSGVGAPVLDFVDSVSAQFQQWVKVLFTQGEVSLAPGLWKARAETLLHPAAAAATAELVATTPIADARLAAAEVSGPLGDDAVVVGGRQVVSRPLFEIFLGEAHGNLALLQQILAAAKAQAEPPIPDIARPAHTLAGVSRTVGFAALSDLGGALESWLERLTPHFKEAAPQALHLFDQSLVALRAMLQKIENRRRPSEAKWLCEALRDAVATKTETLEPSIEPSEEAPQSATAAESVPEAPVSESGEVSRTDDALLDSVPAFVPDQESSNIDQQLLEVFLEESSELMPLVGRQLREWQGAPESVDPQQALQRALHTLKGSARMAGALRMGDDLHELETQIEKALAKGKPTARSFTAFFKQYDSISEQLDELRHHAAGAAVAVEAMTGAELQTPDTVAVTPMMRVRSEAIDHLVNEAGEVSIARSRIERQMETFKSALLELTDSVIRLRSQLREAEIDAETQMQSRLTQLQEAHETFDPLEFDRYTRIQELTRMMAESVHDVATVQQGLMANLSETEAALNEQSRMTKQLQQGLMRTRMVRFDSVSERLHRIVRQTAAELKKPAGLEIRGETIEIDRSVLEKIVGSLEHLLRNAIAHGIEDARKRTSLGKPKAGLILLQARQEGNEIILALSDDGRGLDHEKIKARAQALGLLDDLAESAVDPVSLIFEAGFSTSETLNQVSGRGVGLDAVRADISALGGRIEVASEAGRGSTFTIYLPLTLAINQTVLVRIGKDEFLLPSTMVEQVQKVKHSALAAIREQGYFAWGGRQYPLHLLSQLLELHQLPETQPYTPIMLLRSGARRIALMVDEIRGNREIVVKNIGPQLAGMGGVAGATVMGDGKVMLVLNPIQLAFREISEADRGAVSASVTAQEQPPTILVVDDSLTMRKVITRLLTREGYAALAAKDGVDALQQLESVLPDVILLDIEMPRMDGFELSRAIRGDARTAHIPLIVISSRTADKHRKYAEDLGVNVYLGKPYQEEELLHHLAAFTRRDLADITS